MPLLPAELFDQADHALVASLRTLRQDLHAHPELAFEEHRTAALGAERLRALGLTVRTGIGRTGVVAMIDGALPGPTVGLRADMDALPIHESGRPSYASRCPGVMHACGHDLHTVLALGAAALLAGRRDRLRGRVKIILQPAEETLQGALAMIDDGVLDDPPLDAIVGFHNSPQLAAGTVQYRHGVSMASSAALDIDLQGRSAHAAQPHNGVDALLGAAVLVAQLQHVVARETSPMTPLVLTLGRLEAGSVRNAVAASARIEGTLRCLDEASGAAARAAVERIAAGVAAAHRLVATVRWHDVSPPVLNDARILTAALAGVAGELGTGAVLELAEPSMGGEDFAFFAARVPAAHLRIGSLHGAVPTALHRSDYDANDDVIGPGVRAVAAATIGVMDALAG